MKSGDSFAIPTRPGSLLAALLMMVTAFASATSARTKKPGGACGILFLDLGPIFLDLPGLQVDPSQKTNDVNAVPGTGSLLDSVFSLPSQNRRAEVRSRGGGDRLRLHLCLCTPAARGPQRSRSRGRS